MIDPKTHLSCRSATKNCALPKLRVLLGGGNLSPFLPLLYSSRGCPTVGGYLCILPSSSLRHSFRSYFLFSIRPHVFNLLDIHIDALFCLQSFGSLAPIIL